MGESKEDLPGRHARPVDGNPIFSDADIELLRTGTLDTATRAKLQAKMDAAVDRLKQLEAMRPPPLNAFGLPVEPGAGRLSGPLRWALVLALVLVPMGGLLELVFVGQGFIHSLGNEYRAIGPWLFLALVPVVAYGLKKARIDKFLATRYPTRWVRRYLMFPGVVLTAAGMLVLAPTGWVALLGWSVGSHSTGLEGTMVKTTEFSERKCDYRGTLLVNGIDGEICLRTRVSGPPPKVGDHVFVTGRTSAYGVYVEEIRVR